MKPAIHFRHVLLGILAISFTQASAQTYAPKRYPNIGVGVVRHGNDSLRTAFFNLGLFSNTDTLKGVQLGAISGMTSATASGLNVGGLFAFSGTELNGVQITTGIGSVGGRVRGVQISGISSIAHHAEGLQVAGFSNICTSSLAGVQVSGVSNISVGVKGGAQVAAIANICSSTMRGIQIAAYNYADSLNGSQVGFLNVCIFHPRGVQVGIINYSRDTIAHKIGLVNINPKTKIDVLVYGGTSTKLNFAFRYRNRSTYNIVGVGTHFMGIDQKFSGALFYRVGQYFNLTPKWCLSGDLGYYHVETFLKDNATKPKRLFSLQARINVDYAFNHYLGAFLSGGYGDTRYYYHWHSYRHRFILEGGLAIRFQRSKTR